ncbi:MAG TPA: TIGR03435 family protein [Acidobacteriaceae bacterium]|nr:TIGR03435 family protein [Acidobacteriaceae bacterium]
MKSWLRTVVGAAAILCACGVVRAQDAGQQAAKPHAMATNADPDWEVATVRPSDPDDPHGQHIDFRGRHILLEDTTIQEFLLMGYGMQKGQLAGLPDWAKTDRWNVDGVPDVEGQASWPQLQGMMRKILAERFGLKLHHEQRAMPVFALRVAKGGEKMTANTSDPNGWMEQRNWESNGVHVENMKNISMSELAQILQFHVPRPAVDQTGLKGRWDFKLQWTVDETKTTAPNAPPGIFTAIQEQIGLKLQAVKAPADVLVVDKVERPGAN